MTRTTAFACCLLFAATAVQAVSPSRASANGGGNCPETQAALVEEAAVPGTAAGGTAATPDPNAAPNSAATPVKRNALARPRSGARWHSFLPGMFK